MLKPDMRSIEGQEGQEIPTGLGKVIDSHVHVFPSNIFKAIWEWFDTNAWPIRYRMSTSQIFDFLLSRGIRHIIALQYAHKPGIARQLNAYLSQKCMAYKHQITGMATVFPGEEDAVGILQDAFNAGLGGLKLHAHVQCYDMNSDASNQLYECCQANQKPIVMHVGREPKSEAYRCDPYLICSAQKLECILKDFPTLNVCVPHLGFDEVYEYRYLIEKYNTLWLDTTMAITDYFPMKETIKLSDYRMDRIMYGSDFPNIPYPWDFELNVLNSSSISKADMERILFRNAVEFFNIDVQDE